MKMLLLGCAAVVFTGCSTLTGGATYTYNRTSADVCTLVVESGRVLEGGIAVELNECDVNVEAGKTTSGGNSVTDLVELVDKLGQPKE